MTNCVYHKIDSSSSSANTLLCIRRLTTRVCNSTYVARMRNILYLLRTTLRTEI